MIRYRLCIPATLCFDFVTNVQDEKKVIALAGRAIQQSLDGYPVRLGPNFECERIYVEKTDLKKAEIVDSSENEPNQRQKMRE